MCLRGATRDPNRELATGELLGRVVEPATHKINERQIPGPENEDLLT